MVKKEVVGENIVGTKIECFGYRIVVEFCIVLDI